MRPHDLIVNGVYFGAQAVLVLTSIVMLALSMRAL
jgi:hypothetical protein